jgi:4-diphosphocytidyl-2-C-methyl-D-erythritol kinase
VADRVVVTAPAKVNLVLRVGPARADGYHAVASLLVALDGLGDVLELTSAPRRQLECPGGPDGAANLAWRSADALEAETGRPLPARIVIDKRIPMQAGLGGGSSDAAAVLVGLDRLYGLGTPAGTLERIAAGLGSDVPFFVRGGTQWATGRGEHLIRRPVPEDLWLVICGPVAPLATAAVYAAFDALGTAASVDPHPPDGPWTTPGFVTNDLWPAARRLAPALADAADRLTAAGAETVLLCGSGGAIAGLWRERAAAVAAAARLPDAIAVASPRRGGAEPRPSGGIPGAR